MQSKSASGKESLLVFEWKECVLIVGVAVSVTVPSEHYDKVPYIVVVVLTFLFDLFCCCLVSKKSEWKFSQTFIPQLDNEARGNCISTFFTIPNKWFDDDWRLTNDIFTLEISHFSSTIIHPHINLYPLSIDQIH